MTRKQQEFYRVLINQMIDFNEEFHKEFTIKRIQQIPDEKLKYLLEDINTDKDKIAKSKGYITYTKFIYYADKIIEEKLEMLIAPKRSKVEQLYSTREQLLNTITHQTNSLQERNKLIEDLQNRVLMFRNEEGKNILDECDYFIIEQFGFYNFFDENRNYKIKEEIERYLKLYMGQKFIENQNKTKLLNNN